jgi:hypothetical protein
VRSVKRAILDYVRACGFVVCFCPFWCLLSSFFLPFFWSVHLGSLLLYPAADSLHAHCAGAAQHERAYSLGHLHLSAGAGRLGDGASVSCCMHSPVGMHDPLKRSSLHDASATAWHPAPAHPSARPQAILCWLCSVQSYGQLEWREPIQRSYISLSTLLLQHSPNPFYPLASNRTSNVVVACPILSAAKSLFCNNPAMVALLAIWEKYRDYSLVQIPSGGHTFVFLRFHIVLAGSSKFLVTLVCAESQLPMTIREFDAMQRLQIDKVRGIFVKQ